MMDRSDFERLARHDSTNWWFVAKQRLAVDELRRLGATGPIIDVGCGTGGAVRAIDAAGLGPTIGIDPSSDALAHLGRGSLTAVAANAESLPVGTGAAAGIVSMDVLEHLDDDVAALEEYRRALAPGAALVVAVPAYQWAWTAKDDRLGHRRRYTREQLTGALVAAGFQVERITHYHSWLAPIAFLTTRTPLRRLIGGGGSEAGSAGRRINRLLLAVGTAERTLLQHVRLPFGLSIMATATAPR